MCKSDVIFFKQKLNYRFGVFPHIPSSHVEKKYSPLALAFSLLLNKPVRSLDSTNSIDKFHKRVKKGAFDKADEKV